MSLSELWPEIRGNLIWWVFTLAGGAVVSGAAYLVKGLAPWKRWTLTGLFASLAILCAVLLAQLRAVPERPRVTSENIEGKIRGWLDEFNITSGKVADEHSFFNYLASAPNSPPVTIAREKEHPQFLVFGANITLNKEDQSVYDQLSEQERAEFRMILGAELAKAKITSAPSGDQSTFFPLTIIARTAITPDFNESTFYLGLQQVSYGFIIANNTIELFLRFRTKQPSPTPNTAASPP
jgi:hypothetical protein